MQPLPLSPLAARLVRELEHAPGAPDPATHTYHVASIGSGFYFAYEQLRNITEYRERHLLLRGAIERYLSRYLKLSSFERLAGDLITELTQAGYLKNDSIAIKTVGEIDSQIESYSQIFQSLRQAHPRSVDKLASWMLQLASVRIETMLAPDPKNAVMMQFAYEHYYHAVDRAVAGPQVSDQRYRIALFIATQRALFKSDLATIRYYCTVSSLPNLESQPPEHIMELNQLIDELYQAPMTNRLARLINRYGAPIRILRQLVADEPAPASILADSSTTVTRVKAICAQQYLVTRKNLNGRIAKAILFILITKTLLGIAVEIPYDLAVNHSVSWTPLLINICFPILYMATIGVRIQTPSRHNTQVVADYVERILYDSGQNPVTYSLKRRVSSGSLNAVFSVVYALSFIGSIALLIWILERLGFNFVNGIIFFIFFSAVSFLGFRLRQSAHELALIDERQGVIQTLVDFLSTPFVRVGHWLSDKYAKINLVTVIMDLAIEMPLKTSLRLLRQWISFMRDKQEEL